MNIPTPQCARCGASLPLEYPSGRPCERCLLSLGLSSDEPPMLTHALHDASRPNFPSREELQRNHPELEIKEVLGEGGMGMVLRARQRHLDRDIALKVLRTDITSDSGFAERFEREARTMAKLSHPNIVNVHASGHVGSHYYLMLELVEGCNLRQLIARGKRDTKQVLDIVRQICAALAYAHEQGVVHRDIKPENILISTEGQVKIVDFGLAKIGRNELAGLRLTRTDQAMGTPQYMAPEQIERPLEVDHRADIYSMGVVFYELLTGELPLGRFGPPSDLVQLDKRIDKVVFRTLEKEARRRYQAVTEVTTDMDQIRSEQPPALPKGRASQPAARQRRVDAQGEGQQGKKLGGCALAAIAALVLCCLLGGLLTLLFGVRSGLSPSNSDPAPEPRPVPLERTQAKRGSESGAQLLQEQGHISIPSGYEMIGDPSSDSLEGSPSEAAQEAKIDSKDE